MSPPNIETERLLLRPMNDNDDHHIFRLSLDASIIKYTGDPALPNPEAALSILRDRIYPQYSEHGVGRLAVILRSGEFVGWSGLKYLSSSREYDLAYRFLPEYWGAGFATESGRAILEDAVRRIGQVRIVATAAMDNAASIRVLEKLGLRIDRYDVDEDGPVVVFSNDTPGV